MLWLVLVLAFVPMDVRVYSFLAALLMTACGPSPTVPPQPDAGTAISSSAPSASAPATAPPVHEADVVLQLEPYRTALLTSLGPEQGELVAELNQRQPDPLGHDVLTFRKIVSGSTKLLRVVTVGFGRRSQPYASGSTPPHVELLALSDRDDRQVAVALSTIGRWMHATERSLEARFRPFESLRLEQPVFGMRFFVLVPVGEAKLSDGHAISLLRVIPVGEQEYSFLKMRGEGAVRAWWHRQRTDPLTLRRWTSALAQDG